MERKPRGRQIVIILALVLASCASRQGIGVSDESGSGEIFVAEAKVLQVRRGAGNPTSGWTLTEELNPDTLTVEVEPGKRIEACFFSGDRSLCRTVAIGEKFDFVIRYDGTDFPTRILGVPPAAVFDEAYRTAHRGKISVSIPEVYELVNVAIALTQFADEDKYLVWKENAYYEDVRREFAAVREHPFVQWFDAELRRGRYAQDKMNGYAFVFDRSGRIARSPIYNATGFISQPNTLLPVMGEMQSFADESGFRSFYRAHRDFYREQESFIRSGLNIPRMLDWLKANFPEIEPYDHVNIVFSPLVYGSQSVTWFHAEGFSEIQPHVNFPYPRERPGDEGLSSESIDLQRGALVFTELNHGFINPTATPYLDRIRPAIARREEWVDDQKSARNYGSAESVFNEMMNWALVSLYYVDQAPREDQDQLIATNVRWQIGRGFRRSKEFQEFLVDLYRHRPDGTVTADLYPQIVTWFEEQNWSK